MCVPFHGGLVMKAAGAVMSSMVTVTGLMLYMLPEGSSSHTLICMRPLGNPVVLMVK